MPTIAWPPSWKAIRRRSSSDCTTLRSVPSTIFSIASVRSACWTRSCPRRAASSAASFTTFARSAPTIPGVACASASRSDVVAQRHRAGVHLEDLLAADLVGRLDRHAAVEAPGAQESLVQDLRAVGGGQHHHAVAGLEAVHLGEDLVEGLLALVVAAAREPAAAGSRAADGVELVDEDDGRRGLLGLLEEVAHARGADAHDRLDELRRGDREERHAGLARHRLRQERLARAGRARQQHAPGDARAELAVLLGRLQEVDDLRQLVLGLVDARRRR